jgi:predicted RNA-binding Zn-ribbon protein involved in translation (DUF1610 family)
MADRQASDQKEASAILESPSARSFIRMMLEKSIQTLSPVTSFEKGVAYPDAASLLPEKNDAEVASFLGKLASAGLLEAELVDRLLACPSCRGTEVYSKYRCERCKSFDVSDIEIIEHLLCGYIGAKSGFLPVSPSSANSDKDVGALTCPKCKQKILRKEDYRALGKTFECAICLSHFDKPPVVHKCENCETLFSYKEANYVPVYEYAVSSKAKEIFSSGLLSLGPVADWLRKEGFDVAMPKEISGKSGAKHKFDLVASAGTKKDLLLGDFALAADSQVIVAAFAKRYDINPNAKSFVVTYTQSSEEVETLSRTYGISIIHIGDDKLPVEAQLMQMLEGTPQVIPSAATLQSSIVPSAPQSTPPDAPKILTPSAVLLKQAEKPMIPVARPDIVRAERKVSRRKKKAKTKRREFYFENDFEDLNDDVYLN